jgi:ABC-type Fe3+-siderophore transport system permease subunit
MKRTARPYLISLIILIAAILVSILVGSVFIPPATFLDVIKSAFLGENSLLDPNGTFAAILFKLRAPRTILLVGSPPVQTMWRLIGSQRIGVSRLVPQPVG